MKLKHLVNLLTALLLLSVVFLFFSIYSSSRSMKLKLAEANFTEGLISDIFQLSILSKEFAIKENERNLEQWQRKYEEIKNNLNRAEFGRKSEMDLVAEIAVFSDGLKELNDKRIAEDISPALRERYLEQINVKVENIISAAFSLLSETEIELSSTKRRADNFQYFILSLLCLVGALYSFLIIKNVSQPISRLNEEIKKISQGGNYQGLPEDLKSAEYEVGQLAQDFEKMSLKLKSTIDSVEQQVADRTVELEKLNKYMIGRELKMVELKKEIEALGKAEQASLKSKKSKK